MIEEPQVTWVHRPFLDLLSDSVRLASLALLPNAPLDLKNCGAKGSILHSIFSLESAANSCVATMSYSRPLLEAVDRWQPLEKFEFIAALFNPDERFDRGAKPVQQVREMLKIRNDYVHPKAREIDTHMAHDAAVLKIPAKESDLLKLPQQTNLWEYAHAKRVLQAVCEFYDYFFLRLCRLERGYVTALLVDGLLRGEHIQPMVVEEHRDVLRRAESGMGLKFGFLDLDTPIGQWLDFSYKGEKLLSVHGGRASSRAEESSRELPENDDTTTSVQPEGSAAGDS